MMQRIWAGIFTAWATIAIFAVLAFAHPAPSTTASTAVLARAANGQLVPVAPGGGAHATTTSSGVPVSGGAAQPVTYVKTASGSYVPVASSPGSAAAVTRSS